MYRPMTASQSLPGIYGRSVQCFTRQKKLAYDMQARVSLWLHSPGVEQAVLQVLNKAGLVSEYDRIHDIIKQRINLGDCI